MPTHDVLANKVPTIHCALLGATFRPPVYDKNKRKARHTRFRLRGRKTPVMLATASAQVCVPLGHSSLF